MGVSAVFIVAVLAVTAALVLLSFVADWGLDKVDEQLQKEKARARHTPGLKSHYFK